MGDDLKHLHANRCHVCSGVTLATTKAASRQIGGVGTTVRYYSCFDCGAEHQTAEVVLPVVEDLWGNSV